MKERERQRETERETDENQLSSVGKETRNDAGVATSANLRLYVISIGGNEGGYNGTVFAENDKE